MDRTLVAYVDLAMYLPSQLLTQRKNDLMIMEYFITLKYKPKELQILNRCRLYLQESTLTDLVSVDRITIIPTTLNGVRLFDRKSSLAWKEQQRPPKNAWKLWSSALSRLHCGSKLIAPLTEWISPSHQSWFW